jgi:Alpha/beta hydrolase domain
MTLTGPIEGGHHGWPFTAAVFDVGDYGYVEEEFFIDGEATSYEIVPGTDRGPDGRWQVQPRDTAPFRTRFLVVRPTDRNTFSGNVVLSWANVSAGFELGGVAPHSLSFGDAYVSVSAQKVGLDGYPGAGANALRVWDPERYGTLSHPGDDYSYDILTQIARAVGRDRDRIGVDPMGSLDVERVLATGGSQSAMRLLTYLDAVEPLTHAFDGVTLLVGFGQAAPLSDADPMITESGEFPPGVTVRDDLDIPVFIVSTETEAEGLYPVRQPDTPLRRTWEIAGVAHGGAAAAQESTAKMFVRDGLQVPPGLGDPGDVPGMLPNSIAYFPVLFASQQHLLRWAAGGDPPPSMPLIEMAGDPPEIVRDEHGNARGGIRMPELEAPIAAYRGRADTGLGMLASISGSTEPFPTEKVRALYPTRDDYLTAYFAAVDRGVAAGVFRSESVAEMKAHGEKLAADLDAW